MWYKYQFILDIVMFMFYRLCKLDVFASLSALSIYFVIIYIVNLNKQLSIVFGGWINVRWDGDP